VNGLQPFFFNLIYHSELFLGILGVSFLLYVLIFRHYVFSLFDPMAFDLIYSCIGFAEVVFLFWIGEIENYYFLSYLSTQMAFFAGILMFGRFHKIKNQIPRTRNLSIKTGLNRPLTQIIFAISVLLFLQSVASEWIKNGIPMLKAVSTIEDQPETGMNLLQRISYVATPIGIILSMLYCTIGTKKMRWIGGLVLFLIALISASSGAKQGIISMVFYLGFVIVYLQANGYKEHIVLIKNRNFLFLVAVFVTVLIIRIKYSDQFINAIYYLQFRLLLSGDAFIMGYPHGVIGKLPEYNWAYGLFSGPLRQLHIVPSNDLPPAIGYELYWYHNPQSSLLIGPNSRHNIIGARYLNMQGAIIYSGILGIIYGKTRSGLNYCQNMSPILFVTFCLYCTRISQIEADPLLFQSYVINVTIIFAGLYTISYILRETGTTKRLVTGKLEMTKGNK